MALSGKTHQLFSAAVLYRNGERIWHHLAIAKITMRHLDEGLLMPILIGLVQLLLAHQQAIKSKILAPAIIADRWLSFCHSWASASRIAWHIA